MEVTEGMIKLYGVKVQDCVSGIDDRNLKDLDPEKVRYLVIHCSGTKVTRDYTELQLEYDHIQVRHWLAVGYHFYVRKNGVMTQFRTLREQGAHAKPWNYCSIGICYEGGLDANGTPADTMTEEQFQAITKLLNQLKQIFPDAIVVGHRDLPHTSNKACPCFDASEKFAKYFPNVD